jgi:subtilisin family serine protease
MKSFGVLAASVGIFSVYVALGQSFACVDTLRNEQGETYIREWPQTPGIDYAEDQIIMKTQAGAVTLPPGTTEAALKDCKFTNEDLKQALLQANAYYIKKVFPNAAPADTLGLIDGTVPVRVPDLSCVFNVLLSGGSDVYYGIDLLCPLDDVIWAEPNAAVEPYATPNDEYFEEHQWNLKDVGYGIGCETAWDVTVTSPAIKIGIAGSGIDANHPELPPEKLVGGHNYNDDAPDPDDWGDDGVNYGHETKVAGIAAALTNNGDPGGGVAGIAGGWNTGGNDIGALVYSLRFSDEYGEAFGDDIGRAMRDGVEDFGCDVINISWGSRYYSELMHLAIIPGVLQKKMYVACKGNDGGYRRVLPADLENSFMIAVGGYNPDGIWCAPPDCEYASNHNQEIDIVAPGSEIYTIDLNGAYDDDFAGTSAAAPHATGAVALILSRRPELWPEDMDWMLKYTADDGGEPGYDDYYGWGRLDIGRLFATLLNPQLSSGRIDEYYGYYLAQDVVLASQGTYRFFNDDGPIPEGSVLYVQRWEAFYDITFPSEYGSIIGAWGRRHVIDDWDFLWETDGWSATNPNYQVGYCEVVPGSVTPTGCQIKTNFYYDIYGDTWYPADPNVQSIILCYAAWGRKLGTTPDGRGYGKIDNGGLGDFSVQTYPNPSNSSITISFHLPSQVFVSIEIYDMLGRKVKCLLSGQKELGSYHVVWNGLDSTGKSVDSGVYFCRLQVGQNVRHRRMALVR